MNNLKASLFALGERAMGTEHQRPSKHPKLTYLRRIMTNLILGFIVYTCANQFILDLSENASGWELASRLVLFGVNLFVYLRLTMLFVTREGERYFTHERETLQHEDLGEYEPFGPDWHRVKTHDVVIQGEGIYRREAMHETTCAVKVGRGKSHVVILESTEFSPDRLSTLREQGIIP